MGRYRRTQACARMTRPRRFAGPPPLGRGGLGLDACVMRSSLLARHCQHKRSRRARVATSAMMPDRSREGSTGSLSAARPPLALRSRRVREASACMASCAVPLLAYIPPLADVPVPAATWARLITSWLFARPQGVRAAGWRGLTIVRF